MNVSLLAKPISKQPLGVKFDRCRLLLVGKDVKLSSVEL